MNNNKVQAGWFNFLAFLVAICCVGCGSGPVAKPGSETSLSEKAAVNKEQPNRDESPVQQISDEAFRIAAYEGRTDKVERAIESGTDVNSADSTQLLTALHMAAYNGHSHTVKLLIKKGATIDCRDHEGKTPLYHASTGPFAETVAILCEAGADVNARDSTAESFTPLMTAAALGQTEVVKVLLRHKADKTLVDDDSETALDHASKGGHAEIVQLLR
jgi:ankyrin repeat protein